LNHLLSRAELRQQGAIRQQGSRKTEKGNELGLLLPFRISSPITSIAAVVMYLPSSPRELTFVIVGMPR
jgi:hypothetical protein